MSVYRNVCCPFFCVCPSVNVVLEAIFCKQGIFECYPHVALCEDQQGNFDMFTFKFDRFWGIFYT